MESTKPFPYGSKVLLLRAISGRVPAGTEGVVKGYIQGSEKLYVKVFIESEGVNGTFHTLPEAALIAPDSIRKGLDAELFELLEG